MKQHHRLLAAALNGMWPTASSPAHAQSHAMRTHWVGAHCPARWGLSPTGCRLSILDPHPVPCGPLPPGFPMMPGRQEPNFQSTRLTRSGQVIFPGCPPVCETAQRCAEGAVPATLINGEGTGRQVVQEAPVRPPTRIPLVHPPLPQNEERPRTRRVAARGPFPSPPKA